MIRIRKRGRRKRLLVLDRRDGLPRCNKGPFVSCFDRELSPNRELFRQWVLQAPLVKMSSAKDDVKFVDKVIRVLEGFPNTWREDVGDQFKAWAKWEECLPHVSFLVKQSKINRLRPSDPDAFAELIRRWHVQFTLKNLFSSSGNLLCSPDYPRKASRPRRRIASSLNNIGLAYTELGDLDEAYKTHQKAINICLRTNSGHIGNSYSDMSSLLLRMGKRDAAEEMLGKCPSLKDFDDDTFLSMGNPRFSGDMVLLGRIRAHQGRLDDALRLRSKALTFRQQMLGNRLKTCDFVYHVADLLQKRENSPSAM
ncbi:MAG: hypothetical protein M1830_010155 [Pleopsidium flavum]|nr:MAG: hypothetical protein M1830_010155 [Pleopsidium flavum]